MQERLQKGRDALLRQLTQGVSALPQQIRYVLMLAQLQPTTHPSATSRDDSPSKTTTLRDTRQALLQTMRTHTHADDLKQKIDNFLREQGDDALQIALEAEYLQRLPEDQRNKRLMQWWQQSEKLKGMAQIRAWLALATLLPIEDNAHDLHPQVHELLQRTQRIKGDEARLRAITALMPHLPATQQNRMMQTILDELRTIGHETLTQQTLANIADDIPQEQLTTVLAILNGLDDPALVVRGLMAFVQRVPSAQQHALRAHILQRIDDIQEEDERAEVLIQFVPYLEYAQADASHFPELLEMALATTILINKRATRARVLVALAPHLTLDLQGEALAAVHSLVNERERTRLLSQLAEVLPPDMLVASLAVAHTMREQDSRAQALATLAHHINDSAQEQTMLDALAAVSNLPHHLERVQALVNLLDILPTHLREQAIANALEATRDIDNERARARALALLGRYLSPALRERALTLAHELSNAEQRLDAYLGLIETDNAPLSDELTETLLTTARMVPFDYKRARALVSIIPHLPAHVFPDVEAMADEFVDAVDTANVYLKLIQQTPPEDRVSRVSVCWRALLRVDDGYERAGLLASLAPYLPDASRDDVLRLALNSIEQVSDNYDRASAIALLAGVIARFTDDKTPTNDALPSASHVYKQAITASLACATDTSMNTLSTAIDGYLAQNPHPDQLYTLWRDIAPQLAEMPLPRCLATIHALLPYFQALGGDATIIAIAHLMGVR
jgi:hypothetical protein